MPGRFDAGRKEHFRAGRFLREAPRAKGGRGLGRGPKATDVTPKNPSRASLREQAGLPSGRVPDVADELPLHDPAFVEECRTAIAGQLHAVASRYPKDVAPYVEATLGLLSFPVEAARLPSELKGEVAAFAGMTPEGEVVQLNHKRAAKTTVAAAILEDEGGQIAALPESLAHPLRHAAAWLFEELDAEGLSDALAPDRRFPAVDVPEAQITDPGVMQKERVALADLMRVLEFPARIKAEVAAVRDLLGRSITVPSMPDEREGERRALATVFAPIPGILPPKGIREEDVKSHYKHALVGRLDRLFAIEEQLIAGQGAKGAPPALELLPRHALEMARDWLALEVKSDRAEQIESERFNSDFEQSWQAKHAARAKGGEDSFEPPPEMAGWFRRLTQKLSHTKL